MIGGHIEKGLRHPEDSRFHQRVEGSRADCRYAARKILRARLKDGSAQDDLFAFAG
jgi:hypothetical protein